MAPYNFFLLLKLETELKTLDSKGSINENLTELRSSSKKNASVSCRIAGIGLFSDKEIAVMGKISTICKNLHCVTGSVSEFFTHPDRNIMEGLGRLRFVKCATMVSTSVIKQ